jgi:uncharacterized protein (DUF983 family)
MNVHGNGADGQSPRSVLLGILTKRCPRCRRGSLFRALFVMNENCPDCALDFDRGDPGYFTGAMYFSYLLAIPLIALFTLITYLARPGWSVFRLVVLATIVCSPMIPWIWQYSRVLWVYFDQYFDPEEDEQKHSQSEQERQ